jgi:hypothetical protein
LPARPPQRSRPRATAKPGGRHLAGRSFVAAQLLAGNAEAALAECERRLPQLEREGRVRASLDLRRVEDRALLALNRFNEVPQRG